MDGVAGMHLTAEQMGDLLAYALPARSSATGCKLQLEGGPLEVAEAHLAACGACAEEFAALRDTLVLFQQASIAHAERELGEVKRAAWKAPASRGYSPTLFWAAAAAMLLVGFVPMQLHWQRTPPPPAISVATTPAHASETDEALLEDIDRELSVSVPAPMQSLSDPTGTLISQTSDPSSSGIASRQTSTQRKD